MLSLPVEVNNYFLKTDNLNYFYEDNLKRNGDRIMSTFLNLSTLWSSQAVDKATNAKFHCVSKCIKIVHFRPLLKISLLAYPKLNFGQFITQFNVLFWMYKNHEFWFLFRFIWWTTSRHFQVARENIYFFMTSVIKWKVKGKGGTGVLS